jgi:hypothetical protein
MILEFVQVGLIVGIAVPCGVLALWGRAVRNGRWVR